MAKEPPKKRGKRKHKRGFEEYMAADGHWHSLQCAHTDDIPLMSHHTGVAAHITITLKPCVDIWAAWRYFESKKTAVQGLHVEKIHVGLGGPYDMLADVHAAWTQPMGGETRLIGDWINVIRQPDGSGVCYVESTTTSICMAVDG